MAGRQINDLSGQVFGDLKVLELTNEYHNSSCVFVCRCTCGTVIKLQRQQLTRCKHFITHCGCKGIGKAKKKIKGGLGLNSVTHKLFVNSGPMRKEEAPFNSLFSSYKHQAKQRGYGFDLTKEEFRKLTKDSCHYCGKLPSQEHKRAGGDDRYYVYNGIDRVNPSLGYSVENCVSCCGQCNVIKGGMDIDEFRDWIIRVYEYFCIS